MAFGMPDVRRGKGPTVGANMRGGRLLTDLQGLELGTRRRRGEDMIMISKERKGFKAILYGGRNANING